MSKQIRDFEPVFKKIYGKDESILEHQFQRYEKVLENYRFLFGSGDIQFFSTPGRIEIGGNHTDHNRGRVLAASVNLDAVAAAAPNDSNIVTVNSHGSCCGHEVDLDHLEVKENENCTTEALIRGIAAEFKRRGFQIGGFNAYIHSDVLIGSGLSSSAAIEVLIGTIFNHLFNRGDISAEYIAIIGQYAENVYFGKPCGLMDQMVCAVGGIVTIDFKEPEKPVVNRVNFDFNQRDYSVLVVDTGGNHADLTDDYAAVPVEMKAVAHALGKDVCRDISLDNIMENLRELRESAGDRAVLRAMHFINENNRVGEQVEALENNDFEVFLRLVKESGNSSFKWLQNIYTPKNVNQQGVTLALAITEDYLSRFRGGACRVHGGGFAGTILVLMPNPQVEEYIRIMESAYGKNCALRLRVRSYGSVSLTSF